MIASYLDDARTQLVVFGKDGKRLRDVRLPGLGTAIGFPDSPKENETFFAYTDYLTPLALYRYDVATGHGHAVPQADGLVRPGART